MISPETHAQIRRYFYAEHWKIGTIARELGVHPDTVRNAIETQRLGGAQPVRPSMVDPYLPFIRQILDQYPRLCATRIYQMAHDRGYTGSVVQLRRAVSRLRPQIREPFLRLETLPGEQAQVDWAHFGHVLVGRARRALSCFVMTLSYSRALYLEFFFDQTTENFLRGHVHAFQAWSGQPRTILYDNLKSAVLERRGSQILFNPRLIELTAHYHFTAQPCQVRAGNQKGRVERAIRYVRDSFWAGRSFTTLAECNRQAWLWRDQVAHQRRWPQQDDRTVEQVFRDEQPRLIPLPLHPFDTDRIETVCSRKTIYVRFDLNDYSVPPEAVGRPLTLVASDTAVRLLDGATEIARHIRSYDRQQQVLCIHDRAFIIRNSEGEPYRVAGIAEDTTDRRELEEQLGQSSKMEAIGRLAGGVAHDFNNLLTIIAGYSQMLLDTAYAGDPKRDKLEQILNAANRASVLTKQLLAFSRRQVLQPKTVNLNHLMTNVQTMLGRII